MGLWQKAADMGAFKNQITTSNDPADPATLGDLAAEGLHVFCWCHRCGHNAEMETAPLIARLGPMFPVPELGGRMRCTACEARDVATRPAWPRHGGGQIARYG